MPRATMNAPILVSVIIPVYGVEQYLPQCLDSVLAQTLTEIEVLCIDDASPDRCPEILDSYAEKDSRIRVFHLAENRRQGHGRNLGFKEARGKYVYFLDSDDLIAPEAMEVLYRTAEKDGLQGVLFDSQVIFESDELRAKYSETYIDVRKGAYPDEPIDGMTLTGQMLENKEWTVLVQREFWLRDYLLDRGILFPEDAEHEDQFFSIASMLAAQRVRYIPDQLFIRRFRPNSVVTSKAAPKNFHGYLVNAVELIAFVRRQGLVGRPVDVLMNEVFANLDRLYPVFLNEGGGEDWFKTDQLKDFYAFYCLQRRAWDWQRESDGRLFAPLAEHGRVWIYGAGRVGQSVLRRLRLLDMSIGGFIVTDATGNPAQVQQKEVVALADYVPGEDDAILVAMARDLHQEVSCKLQERGLTHFLYFNNVLKGPF